MDDLIEDIRELVMEDRAMGTIGQIPLHEAVSAVFDEIAPRAEERGVKLVLEHDLPDIQVDPTRVEIALMNLVNNAVKYADPEKAERWVRVGAKLHGNGDDLDRAWIVHVADNGLGIPESLQNRVFARHFRAHPEVAEGTGFGLSIARHLAMQAGGAIDFESKEGEGTTFYLTIPDRLGRGEG